MVLLQRTNQRLRPEEIESREVHRAPPAHGELVQREQVGGWTRALHKPEGQSASGQKVGWRTMQVVTSSTRLRQQTKGKRLYTRGK